MEVVQTLRAIDLDKGGSDGAVSACASACNYETLYAIVQRVLTAVNTQARTEKDRDALKYYRQCANLFGFIKLCLDFYGGFLGIMWL